MTETEFIEAIDSRFPYASPLKWKPLVSCAPRISPNAAFMVLHELCRPPSPLSATYASRRIIFDHLTRRFRHPLLSGLRALILTSMRGELVSVSTAAAAMRRVARYPGQENILAICYFSCNDRNGRLDALYESIVDAWSMLDDESD
jgi:hypothetical protein